MKKSNKFARFVVSLIAMFSILFASGVAASADVVYGDIDNSGKVTAADATIILRHIAEIETLNGDTLQAADVDGSGSVNAADVTMVLKKVAGLIEKFPAESSVTDNTAGKTLVVYYSATGSTKVIAELIAEKSNGDLFEIVPQEPYTSDDLNWTDSNSRVVREHNDESLRNVPLKNTTVDNWSDYDTVFIGYPIWWGIAAWPTNGFVTANDFSGKTVIPFCTSSSSGIGNSGTLLEQSSNGGKWLAGKRFSSYASESEVADWLDGLEL